jgi:hypothetical protein
MELLASKWKLIFLVGGVAGLAIFAFLPDYNTLQMSSDAKDFTSTLGDDEGRALTANICDMIFALSYGVLGVVAFRKLAMPGAIALPIFASLADEIENVLVFLNIKSDALTDGRVDAMTAVGSFKWAFIAATFIALAIALVRARKAKSASS